jgi:hypothetical protein
MTDKYHGQGGTFKINANSERERVGEEVKPHPEGDRPRDEHGKPFEENIATAPAVPAPGPAPWEADAKKAADLAAAGRPARAKKGD